MYFGTPEDRVEALRSALQYLGASVNRSDFLRPGYPDSQMKFAAFQKLLADKAARTPIPIDG